MTWEGLNPPYRTILVDPPWPYEKRLGGPGHGNWVNLPFPYSCLTLSEIEQLPIAELARSDCRLFLWTTNRFLPAAFEIVKSWGFRYRQTLVWSKIDSNLGGSVAPTSAEFLLAAAKGSVSITARWATAVIETVHPRTHSTKPGVFGDLIEAVSPGPYVELFARQPRLGWDHWGYGYEVKSA